MTSRKKINLLIRLITLTTGLVIGGGVSASVIEVNAKTSPVIGHAPVVNDVTFDKTTPAVNDTVTATPKIKDEDDDTLEPPLYQWQLDGKNIAGATKNSYKLAPTDGNGKKLTVTVTPQTDPATTDPASGTAFTSPPLSTLGLAPEALDVRYSGFSGTPKVGDLLTGSYRYHDADGDPEDTSGTRIEWICLQRGSAKILATGNSYTLQKADIGCSLYFQVIPRSRSGTPNTGMKFTSTLYFIKK
ncbi:hypothetical protein U0L13_003346 [Providencia stuartii]|uniref:Intimin-like protein SinH n=1 Tax=Providencia stuartii TaxID=588 RepID=A0AAI9I3V5_PROST|nr:MULTISPECIES: hypothetical protein [Providencia]ELR5037132.1 hypothetical protein [Providencia stuartii]ELZ5941085.1 hypothetical protein [Providencia stuartii]MCK1143272.1 hypothetical protein [Providencia stuartii]